MKVNGFDLESNSGVIEFHEITRDNTWIMGWDGYICNSAMEMARRIDKFYKHINKPYFEWCGDFYLTESVLKGEYEKLVVP